MQENRLIHFFNRATFGIDFSSFITRRSLPFDEVVSEQISNDTSPELALVTEDASIKYAQMARSNRNTADRSEARKMVLQELQKNQKEIRNLNLAWMQQMHQSAFAFREKLTFFWHDHFGVRVLNVFRAQVHNNTLRKHALGKYKDLLLAVAKDPAMLQFLNNQQNTKAKPNENFARELLELFTIGRGNYTERDIKNAARAFTGWSFNPLNGDFRLRFRQHDNGEKTFFGKQGNLTGEDIIDIVLEDKRTAEFLAAKFFKYYVSDTPDPKLIQELADYYYQNEYDTGKLLSYMFRADWFYEDRFLNAKIKSPIELLNGYHHHLGLDFRVEAGWLLLQRNFSQTLFQPPSVNGWPLGREWIDSSSLVNRMKLPRALAGLEKFERQEEEETDANDAFKVRGDRVIQTARLNFEALKKTLNPLNDQERLQTASTYLLNTTLSSSKQKPILEGLKNQESDMKSEWLILTLASMPEYQLN